MASTRTGSASPGAARQGTPVESGALRGAALTAEMRRRLASLMDPESRLGMTMALDLMNVPNPSAAQLAYAVSIARTHQDGLRRASLFYARSELVALIDQAAPSMPDQTLNEFDVIVPDGFVAFETPLPDSSGAPPCFPLHAMSWMTLEEGHPILETRGVGRSILITAYCATADIAANFAGGDPRLMEGSPRWLPTATVAWTYGTLIGEAFGEVPDPEAGNVPGFFQRALAAFWTLSQQPRLTASSPAPQGRPTDQRKARRQGVADPGAPVSVVRLQRTQSLDDSRAGDTAAAAGESGRKVGVRFPVRPFWRKQWYPSVEQHRHVLILGHWRGPEDAPVVHGERVFLALPPKPSSE